MISSSIGLIVCMLIISASIPSAASISTAFTASDTQSPVAMIDMSLPSLSLTPLPISNLYVLSSLSTGTASLPNLRYTGPTYSYAAFTAALASTSSHGLMTTMPGISLMSAISSQH